MKSHLIPCPECETVQNGPVTMFFHRVPGTDFVEVIGLDFKQAMPTEATFEHIRDTPTGATVKP